MTCLVSGLSRVVAVILASLALVSCGGGGGPAPASGGAPVGALPPSAPMITINPAAPAPGVVATFGALSTDPAGLAITYRWDFGDGSAKVTAASTTHAYSTAGSYTATATATNTSNLSAASSRSVAVSLRAPINLMFSSSANPAVIGQTVVFSATATDPGGLPLTYSWTFGDAATATGNLVNHAYTAASTYSVTVTASNGTLSTSVTSQQPVQANSLLADCTGTGCGASNVSGYFGSGIGVWRYANTSASDVTLSVNINNVPVGKKASLIFVNNGLTAGSTPPGGGTLAEPALFAQALASNELIPNGTAPEDAHDVAHHQMTEKNRGHSQALRTQSLAGKHLRPSSEFAGTAAVQPKISAVPAVGTQRSWNDTYGSSATVPAVKHTVAVNQTCATTATGRNVVFWLDTSATTSTYVTPANMASFASRFCGPNGAFAQLSALIGDAWGPTVYSNLIGDGPLQDINIVILNVPPASTTWAGYFDSTNNFLAASSSPSNYVADSNEAIAFNINASQVQVQGGVDFISSTLVHEATHMINFYQRAVLKGTDHDTWLEETSAMISEDTLSNAVFAGSYNKISDRTRAYLATGGGVDYANWLSVPDPRYYNIGGAFGAYLNRKYGLAIMKGLVNNCNDGGTTMTTNSYACLDSLIKSLGGAGFAEDYSRFGASVFARIPPTGQPVNYGYPAKTDGASVYSAFNPSLWAVPPTTSGVLRATQQQHFITDTTVSSPYTRNNVVIPANTTLTVVIQ